MRHEGLQERLCRIEQEVAHGDIVRCRIWNRAADAPFNRYPLESGMRAQQLDGARHVLLGVVGEIKAGAELVGV